MTRELSARQMPTLAPETNRRGVLKSLVAVAVIPAAATAVALVSADAAILAFGPKLDQLEAEMCVAHDAYRRGGRTEELEEAWEAPLSDFCEVVLDMCAVPASTLDGIQFKARYAHVDPMTVPIAIADDLRSMQALPSTTAILGRGGF